MDSDKTRQRISDAADDIAQKDQEQESADYPAADRAKKIRETAGD